MTISAEGSADAESRLKRSTAMFLMKTKEVNGVSQRALNELVEDVTLMVERTVDTVKSEVEQVLLRNGINEKLDGFDDVFEIEWLRHPFRGLHSEFRQHEKFKELFGLVVSMHIQEILCMYT